MNSLIHLVLPGLPDGIEVVGYDEPKAGDFTMWDGSVTPAGPGRQFIVKPASGYEFGFDVLHNRFLVRKK